MRTSFKLILPLLALGFALTSCEKPDPNNVQRVDPLQSSTPSSSNSGSTPAAAPALTGEVSLARNFYFVFDGSGSMASAPPSSKGNNFGSKLECAKWAVKEFLKSVPDDPNKPLQLGLYVFDAYGEREVIALAPNNRAALLAAIDNIRDGGGTPLGASIERAVASLVEQYKKQLGYGDFRAIVVTDGESSDSLGRGVNDAARFNVPLHTIGFALRGDHELRKYSASYKNADSATELKEALKEAAAELDVFDDTTFKTK